MVSEFEVIYLLFVVKLKLVFYVFINLLFRLLYWVLIVSVYFVVGFNFLKVFI